MRKFPRGLFFREVEMQAKRLLSCGFAFLMVLAFAGGASALDVSEAQGTWVRIKSPDDGAWVAIGDSIVVEVSTVSAATGITVSIVQPDGDDEGTVPDPFTAGVPTLAQLDISGTDDDVDRSDGTLLDIAGGVSNVPDAKLATFIFRVTADATNNVSKLGLFVQVAIVGGGAAEGTIFNTTEDEQILAGATGFATTKVGGGRTFGIDNQRPIHTAAGVSVFTNFELQHANGTRIEGAVASSGTATNVDGDGLTISTVNSEIKEDDEVNVSLTLNRGLLIASGASKARVIFVKETYPAADTEFPTLVTGAETTLMDSAIATVEFNDPHAAQPRKRTLDTSEGIFGNGQRVRAFAFLEDEAGNLGAATAADGPPAGAPGTYSFTTDDAGTPDDTSDDTTEDRVNLFMIDTTTPTVTVAYPKSGATDSTYVSAKKEQSLSYYSDSNGTRGPNNKSDLLRPLTLKIDEAVDSIKVEHGDFSETYRTADGDLPEDVTEEFKLELPDWKDEDDNDAGEAKLVVTAWDVVANDHDVPNDNITYDNTAPAITNLFPSEDSAPGDPPTIHPDTDSPVIFTNSEDLDSLLVQYLRKDTVPVEQANASFGGARDELKEGRVKADIDFAKEGNDELEDGGVYFLQLIAFDKAGNGSATVTKELTFDKDFENPIADSFMVDADDVESVITGADLVLALTALDSAMTAAEGSNVAGVTYGQGDEMSRVRVEVPEDQADRLESVTFSGEGVEIAAADTGMGIATLNPDNWEAGERSVNISSELTLTGVTVFVEGLDDQGNVSFKTEVGPFTFDSGAFSQFTVQAMEDGEATDNVIGEFQISVTATDEFGNESMKIEDTLDDDLEDDSVYETIAIEISSNNPHVTVPPGRQEIVAGANIIPGVASEASGTVVLRVFTDDPIEASGTDTLSFGPTPPPPPPPDPTAPAAPDTLFVEDYEGPNGEGDQGGLVLVSFPKSADHATVDKYQIYRELTVTTIRDSIGNLIVSDDSTTNAWVPWAVLEAEDPNADTQRGVIPALDNIATKWAVAAIGVAGPSDKTTSVNKRVFTKESVQQTLELLGMPEAELLTDDELMNQFNAPEDYVKSILGDQKNLVFAPVNPDLSVLLGNGSIPSNIRTSGHPKLASPRTETEEAVGAEDNIAPAPATDAAGALGSDGEAAQVSLSWTTSTDDGRIVSLIQYRGYNLPIYGVKGYNVLRSTKADETFESIGKLPVGSTEFVDTNLPEDAFNIKYRIDAFDDNNDTPGQPITVQNIGVRAKFADAEGEAVYLMVLPPVGDMEVNFEDVIAFAAAFGSQKGDDNYSVQADVNDDGTVDFSDFLQASESFGRTAAAALNKLAVVAQRPGANADTEMRLELTSEKVLVGETISVTVSMANARALNGYGLELMYDADKFEFVSAAAAEKDLLKSEGGETPLFKNWADEGRVTVVNAIIGSGSVGGEGALVTFTFKVLREFEDSARFEIAQGVVFDPERLSNPVVTLGALDVQSTPTEFALHQNYPNPFNPQTNIPYDLAEGGDVVLRIYNLLGQEVRTLVRERQAPGRYTVQWSGMDDRGVSVSSGIYFYQVSVAGKFQDAKRLMLLK